MADGEFRLTGDPDRDDAALELNAAVEVVLETVDTVNGPGARSNPVVQEFVQSARKLAVNLGWLRVTGRPG